MCDGNTVPHARDDNPLHAHKPRFYGRHPESKLDYHCQNSKFKDDNHTKSRRITFLLVVCAEQLDKGCYDFIASVVITGKVKSCCTVVEAQPTSSDATIQPINATRVKIKLFSRGHENTLDQFWGMGHQAFLYLLHVSRYLSIVIPG